MFPYSLFILQGRDRPVRHSSDRRFPPLATHGIRGAHQAPRRQLSPPDLRPVTRGERIDLLDVLRGFALGGIVGVNYQVFSGLLFMSPAELSRLGVTSADQTTQFLIHLLLEQKFYSLFSLLFGIGFSILMRRAAERGSAFAPFFHRRLTVLLGIGFVHAILIWPGDILILYAVLGFVLLVFRDSSNRSVLRWGIGLLSSPILIYAGFLAVGMPDPMAMAAEGAGPSLLARMLAAFRQGSYPEVVAANATMYAGSWIRYLLSIRIPRVLGMFLIGVWLDRRNIFRDPEGNRALLVRAALWGAAIGLPANLAVALLREDQLALPASGRGLLHTTLSSVGVPALALAYAAAIGLAMLRPAWRSRWMVLAPMGRMALTQYLLQSVAGIAIFYGLGLGLFGRVRPVAVCGIALAVFAVQVVLSRIWMARFAFGPAEWVWRRLTYRGPVAFRRSPSKAAAGKV
jgi:uncharacterized protein